MKYHDYCAKISVLITSPTNENKNYSLFWICVLFFVFN